MRKSVALLVFSISSTLWAQIGGGSIYQFLNLVPSARIAAQGGNAIANVENDLNFAIWNPSLLNKEMHGQASVSMVDHVSDIIIGDLNYAHHFDSIGTFFVSIKFVDYGNFDRTDVLGVKQGTFTVTDYVLNVGYSYTVDTNWRVGSTLKFINSAYDEFTSYGFAGDLAAIYQIPSKRIVIALVAKNLGFQFNPYSNENKTLPFEIQLGFSNRFKHLPLGWQITLEQLETWDLRYSNSASTQINQFTGGADGNFPSVWNNIFRHVVLGVELSPIKSFNLQFGYNFRKRQELNLKTRRTSAGFSFGLGFKIYKFRLSYGRNMHHISGSANHFSIIADLQDFR